MNSVCKALVETKSVYLEPKRENYFTWTSGIKSPIYCDNRQLISYPSTRNNIIQLFVGMINEKFENVELIAGTATAGIPWAAWISNDLNLPMVYIRNKPKEHGLKSAIEGYFKKGSNVLIIEDLISTGKSSYSAYKNAKIEGLNILGIMSIFNYNLDRSNKLFQKNDIQVHSLCDLDQLLKYANDKGSLSTEEMKSIKAWRSQKLN